MVFRVITKQKETSPNNHNSNTSKLQNKTTAAAAAAASLMSSSTLKSHHQPLHNFPLQDLKWSMNNTNSNSHHHNRFRNTSSSSHKSPHRDAHSDAGALVLKTEKSDKKKLDNSDKKSKIFIRIKTKTSNNSKCTDDDDSVADTGDNISSSAVVTDDADETLTKTWNLRPRKSMTKAPPPPPPPPPPTTTNNNNGGGGALRIGVGALQEIKAQELSRTELTRSQRNAANANDNNNNNNKKEKEKKVKFSIPLTKDEIEEDVYALTGSKPSRRPKKRAKHLQKQLDCLFPGLWLASVTPDVYKVPDTHPKG